MNNIKDKVYKALTDEGLEVTDIYPKDWAKLPAVQYVEEDNSVAEWTDDKEQTSHVLYRIEIWDTKSTSGTALKVDKALSAMGLKRVLCKDIVTDGIIEKVAKDIDDASGLRHKKMNYEAYYDSDYIYHGM